MDETQRDKFKIIVVLSRDEFIALRDMADRCGPSGTKTNNAMKIVALMIIRKELIDRGFLKPKIII